ncbi:MAG: hypothetical protein B7Z55_07110 [Planctomycetales bacterium 12-60-4]|nr:MAG: hypothetical protein B7Z55_07110 [Planctomycetales bacterium 12-60-4]
MAAADEQQELVPDEVIPHQHLAPLRYRDMPESISWTRMVGPSIILAGLALGSGEFILWPLIVYKAGFLFCWAALLGIVTQYFINMEIERWTLLTGESTITGFCRLSWHWSYVFLLMNIIPWAFPGWSTGAAHLGSWLAFGPREVQVAGGVTYEALYVRELAIVGLVVCGIVLTAGPVVYNTVEQIQTWLVGLILGMVVLIACMVVRGDAIVGLGRGLLSIGSMPDPESTGLSMMQLLGALAFAGVGGTLNLGQSNYVKDKGYGMGLYIGRITSPLTGKEETVEETGYHFHHTPENMSRWRAWWRAANIEHFASFLMTCCATLFLLVLIAYSLLYDEQGQLREGARNMAGGFDFVWAQAQMLKAYPAGQAMHICFLMAGIALLLTTELGVLDCVARISADIVSVNFVRAGSRLTVGNLYFLFLWSEIAIGAAILIAGTKEPTVLIQIAAALNGGVMFLYSLLLLYMNAKILPRSLAITPFRFLALVWACAFFGYFTIQSLRLALVPLLTGAL